MSRVSEYEVESLFIDRLESIGYKYIDLAIYDDVVANFRAQLAKFNAEALIEVKGEAAFTDDEFERVLIHVENHSVYESAKILRDKYVLTLDNGEQVYLDFFSSNTDRNTYVELIIVELIIETVSMHLNSCVERYVRDGRTKVYRERRLP